jgi:hypothetical protein
VRGKNCIGPGDHVRRSGDEKLRGYPGWSRQPSAEIEKSAPSLLISKPWRAILLAIEVCLKRTRSLIGLVGPRNMA